MADLTGQSVDATFAGLLQVPGGLGASLTLVEDGSGTSSVLKLSTSDVEVAGGLTVTGGIGYTPATPGDWPAPPTTVGGALDDLADRLGDTLSGVTFELTATALSATTSTTPVLVASMTYTPAAGTYWVSFSAMESNGSNNRYSAFGLYVGGALVTHSYREQEMGNGGIRGSIQTQALVTVNGAQAIEVRHNTEAGGTSNVYERSMAVRPA